VIIPPRGFGLEAHMILVGPAAKLLAVVFVFIQRTG
jgi:hypothetical protein